MGPLTKHRHLKLFSLREIAAPSYALDNWPVRCHLKTHDGLYLSNTAGKLSTNAEVHCCSEELILDLSGQVTIVGNNAIADSCLWSSNATRVASVEPSTKQLTFQSQHSCFGREAFNLQFHHSNELTLTQQTAAAGGGNDGNAETAGLVCKWPSVRCTQGVKPTKLTLEIASKPVFLITAHGGFAAASNSHPSSAVVCTLPRQTMNPSAEDLSLASWQFEHRGDNLYTIQHLGTKNLLYVGHAGTLRMDGNQPHFPDFRLLFSIQIAWTKFDGSKKEGEESAQQSTAGFLIKSAFKLNGKQLCLSALPDGRIATCYIKAQPSRWELFAVADTDAVLNSGAKPISRLPLRPTATPAVPAMRRSSSCNAMPGRIPSSSSFFSTSPPTALPGILEDSDEETCSEQDTMSEISSFAAPGAPALTPPFGAPLRGRRCASESALTQLHSSGIIEEPKWLAALLRIPPRPAGWNIRSGATMQAQSCQALCSEALRNAEDFPDENPADKIEAAGPLPEDVKCRILNNLKELTMAPEPAKLSYPHVAKAVAHGTAPEWSQSLLVHAVEAETIPEELAEVSHVLTFFLYRIFHFGQFGIYLDVLLFKI